jgi:ribosomal protein L37AE/L43A
MAEEDSLWPPAPSDFPRKTDAAQASDKPACPACGRKLLTLTSVLCNWCGAVIENDEYQQRAAETRAAQDAAERERLETEISETARMGVLGRLKQKGKAIKRQPDRMADLISIQEAAEAAKKQG